MLQVFVMELLKVDYSLLTEKKARFPANFAASAIAIMEPLSYVCMSTIGHFHVTKKLCNISI